METTILSVAASLLGILVISLIYSYLYIAYKERFMGLWAICWIAASIKYIAFDFGIWRWHDSAAGPVVYQFLVASMAVAFLAGTSHFFNKPVETKWFRAFWGLLFVNSLATLPMESLAEKLFLPVSISCFIGIWSGIVFLYYPENSKIGGRVAGYALIGWCASALALPYLLGPEKSMVLASAASGILYMLVALGALLSYFERNKSELLIKREEYRALAENSVDALYVLHFAPHIKIQYISPSAAELVGLSASVIREVPAAVLEKVLPDDRETVRKYIAGLPESVHRSITFRMYDKNKNVRWMKQKCVAICDQNGQLVEAHGFVRDITERINLETATSDLARMSVVSSMAATVAHEIRNPLTTVQGYLQIMARKQQYSTEKERLNMMMGELNRANDILNEYLSMARRQPSHLEACSLSKIMEGLFPLLSADALRQRTFLRLDVGKAKRVLACENDIRQMLLNLVRNGIEAMPDGGELVIGTYMEQGSVVMFVKDHGSGIPSEILKKIGNPFVTTKECGTGLGLSTCYQIAARNKAKIKIDTSAAGTNFMVYFQS